MVIEHTFITTLDGPVALQAAAEMLGARGFINAEAAAFPMGQGEWSSIEMRRGRRKPRGMRILQLPQVVRVEFDRGRVTVAASVAGTRRSFWTGVPVDASPHSLKGQRPLKMMTAICHALEQRLAHQRPAEQAIAALTALDEEIAKMDRACVLQHRLVLLLAVVLSILALTAMSLAIIYW